MTIISNIYKSLKDNPVRLESFLRREDTIDRLLKNLTPTEDELPMSKEYKGEQIITLCRLGKIGPSHPKYLEISELYKKLTGKELPVAVR